VFHIEVNHVKSGFFSASKQNEIFASSSNFASEAKVRAHRSAGWIGAPIISQLCFADFFFMFGLLFGAGCIGAPLLLADYKEDDCVLCASPIFMLIAYYLGFTKRKRKYFEEKMMATLKIKLTSITTVRNHILTVACFPTPLIFHYPLSLKGYFSWLHIVFFFRTIYM
jgi:hypothetical protein